MGLPNVHITVARDGLGLVSFTQDGIMGLCLTGVAVADKLELNKPYSLFSLADAGKIVVEPAGANDAAYKQIKEFYDESGAGKKLWIIVSPLGTTMSARVNNANETAPARLLLDAANGEIAVLGVSSQSTGSTVNGLDADVWTAMNNMQILADSYQDKIMPFCGVVAGGGFTGDSDAAADLHTMTKHRCTVILTASENDGVASVGQFLGRLAAIPVQRKVSRVKDGELTNLNAYLTDGAKVDDRMDRMGVLHDKGYVVYRTFPGKSGYYYSGDPTATVVTDDLCVLARNRVIDKAIKITYNTYVEELDDDVPTRPDGTLEPGFVGYMKSKIEQQVNANMADEISGFIAQIDANQNILSGLPLNIVLRIIPKGYLNEIHVELGFTNPFNN